MAYSFLYPFEKLTAMIKEIYREILNDLYTKEEFWEQISAPITDTSEISDFR